FFFFSSRRRHTRFSRDWSSDVCSSDLSCTASALISWLFIYFFDNNTLLPYSIKEWSLHAIPFFVILSLLGGVLAVYFTLLVTRRSEERRVGKVCRSRL